MPRLPSAAAFKNLVPPPLVSLAGRSAARLRKTSRQVRRATHPLRRQDVDRALAGMGPMRAPFLFVHSSLSACGDIRGGPATVINALESWAAGATLVMPTHTYCYPDAQGEVECFEPRRTRSLVGAITDAMWRQPGVVRSIHPSHSLAAHGPRAVWLCQGHVSCPTPCGSGTPYAKMVEARSSVVMFGARMDAYTLFHTAEHEARVPYLYQARRYVLRARDLDGVLHEVPMLRQDMTVRRCFKERVEWMEQQGLLSRHPLGMGELLYVPDALAAHGALVAKLLQDPYFLVSSEARRALGV